MIEEVAHPHPSILHSKTTINLSKCVSDTCGCRWVHCPLCAPGRIGVGTQAFIQKHFDKIHDLPSVSYNGFKLLVCLLKCAEQKHYHCPKCGEVIPKATKSRSGITEHLAVCDGQQASSSSRDVKIEKLEVCEELSKDGSKIQGMDEESMLNCDDISKDAVKNTIPFPHVSILHKDEELQIITENKNGQMINVCILCGATVKLSHFSRHRSQHMTSQIQWADCRMLGCSGLSCLRASSTRRSRYQLHFHCPWCTDVLMDRRSALTHYSSRHGDLTEGSPSSKRPRSPSAPSSGQTEHGIKRFKPNGRIKDEPSETDWQHEEVFAQVTAVISETVLRHSCLSPSQLCDRLQLETGVSCDSHTGDLTLLGSWDQLEKARQLIRKCSLGNKTTKSKTRTVAPSEMLHGTTKKLPDLENCNHSVSVSVLHEAKRRSRRPLKTRTVRLRARTRKDNRVESQCKTWRKTMCCQVNSPKSEEQSAVAEQEPRSELPVNKMAPTQDHERSKQNSVLTEGDDAIPAACMSASLTSVITAPAEASPKGCTNGAELGVETTSKEGCLSGVADLSPLTPANHNHDGVLQDNVIIQERQNGDVLVQKPKVEGEGAGENISATTNGDTSLKDGAETKMSAACVKSNSWDKAATNCESFSDALQDTVSQWEGEPASDEVRDLIQEKVRHAKVRHKGERSELCPVCSESLPLRQLIKHMLTTTKCSTKLADVSLNEISALSARVVRLVRGMRDITNCTCPSCGTKRNSMSQVLYHYAAGLCHRNSENMRRNMEFFRAHGVIHDPLSKLYKCSHCNIQARKPIHLKNHIEAVHLPKIFSCPHCPRRFSTKEKKEYHMRVHVDLVKCEHCNKSFMKSYLMQHISKIHQATDIRCDLCEFVTKSEAYLRRHMENRHSTGHHLCEWCGKHFGQKTTMLRHVNAVHLGIKYKRKNPAKLGKGTCNICGLTMLKKNLNTHIQRRHEGLKLFACDVCGASFTSKHSVKVHKLKHMSDEERSKMQKYGCDLCGQRFYKRYLQQEHIKAHGALYDCQKCGKHFRYRHSLLQHQKRPGMCRLTEDTEHVKCSLCAKVYPTARKLENHMTRVHQSVITGLQEVDAEQETRTLACSVKEELHETNTHTTGENITEFIVQEVEEIGDAEPIIQGTVVEHILGEVNNGQDGMSLVWSKDNTATARLQSNELVTESSKLVTGTGPIDGSSSQLVKLEDGSTMYSADLNTQTFAMIQNGEATEFHSDNIELQPGEEFVMIDGPAPQTSYCLQEECVQYQCGHCNMFFVSIDEVNAHVNLCHL